MKKSKFLNILALISMLGLAGCAGQPLYKPMQESVSNKVKNTSLIHVSSQQELIAEFEVSQAGLVAAGGFGALGGLIGAMVDTGINQSRASEAEETVLPLRDILIDYDFKNEMEHSINAVFEGSKWHQDKLILIAEDSSKALDAAIKEKETDGVISISTAYHMSPNFNDLKVMAHVNLFPNTPELKAIQKDLYTDSRVNNPKSLISDTRSSLFRNQINLLYPISSEVVPKELAVKMWQEEEGQVLKDALAKAVEVLPKVIKYDLETTISDEQDPNKYKTSNGEQTVQIDGYTFSITRGPLGLTVKLL